MSLQNLTDTLNQKALQFVIRVFCEYDWSFIPPPNECKECSGDCIFRGDVTDPRSTMQSFVSTHRITWSRRWKREGTCSFIEHSLHIQSSTVSYICCESDGIDGRSSIWGLYRTSLHHQSRFDTKHTPRCSPKFGAHHTRIVVLGVVPPNSNHRDTEINRYTHI